MAATLTEFQRKKIRRVFSLLYDSNHDGKVDKEDFDILLTKIREVLEWEVSSNNYKDAVRALDNVWDELLKLADENKDSKITIDEWLQMWGECLKTLEKGDLPDWQRRYMKLMFDVNDKSGDDCIDETEYTTFLSQFGISQSECKQAFQTISGGQNITRDQFATLWKDYLTSDDSASPGNYLFGLDLDSIPELPAKHS